VSNFELATCGHERRTQYPAHHRNESYAIRGGRARSATRVIVAEGEEVWRLVPYLLNGVPSHGYDLPGLEMLRHRVRICTPGAWHPDLFSGHETFDVGGAPRKLWSASPRRLALSGPLLLVSQPGPARSGISPEGRLNVAVVRQEARGTLSNAHPLRSWRKL
jgi:hypothetical protein